MQEVPNSAPEHEPIPQRCSHSPTCCCKRRVTMGELCWSNTLDRISRPDRTLSTSLGETSGQKNCPPRSRYREGGFSLHHKDARVQVRKSQEAMTGSLFRARGQRSGHLCSKGEQVRTGQRGKGAMHGVGCPRYLCSLRHEVARVRVRWGRLLAPLRTASRSSP